MKVTYVDHMGSDLSVVNAARVSFDKESDWVYTDEKVEGVPNFPVGGTRWKHLSAGDTRLIQFLARGMTADNFKEFVDTVSYTGKMYEYWFDEGVDVEFDRERETLLELLWKWRETPLHWAPFAHPHVTFRIKAPVIVARQLVKHQVGGVWSEISRRYVDSEPEFYTPEVWRKRAENVKQGSSDEAVTELKNQEGKEHLWSFIDKTWHPNMYKWHPNAHVELIYQYCNDLYKWLLESGVCPEQARMVLPQSMFTEWQWTGSLYFFANVYRQRHDVTHAQRETAAVADQIGEHMKNLYPVSWAALVEHN